MGNPYEQFAPKPEPARPSVLSEDEREKAISMSVLFATMGMGAYKITEFDTPEIKSEKTRRTMEELLKNFISMLDSFGYTVVKKEL